MDTPIPIGPVVSESTEEDAITVSRILDGAEQIITLWCGEYLDGRLVVGHEYGKLIPLAFHFKSIDMVFEGLFFPKPDPNLTIRTIVDEMLKDVADIHAIKTNQSKNEFIQSGGKLS